MGWIDRIILLGVAAAVLGAAALYAGAERPASAVQAAETDQITGTPDLDRRIARIVEGCVIEGAGTHLAFIRCGLRD